MKKKLLTYLLTAVVLTTTAIINTPITAYAITQDEGAAYAKYIKSLLAQGYSKSDIEKILNRNPNGSLTSAVTELPPHQYR